MPTLITLIVAGLGLFGAYKIGHLQGRVVGRQTAARQLYAECKRRGWVA